MERLFDEKELLERIDLNYKRLEGDPYYQISDVFDNHRAR